MKRLHDQRMQRRGVAALAMVIVMALLSLAIVGMILGGARDMDLTVSRMDSLRAFYAAEAGANMSIRELMENSDEDGDGGIGSISDDGNDANDPQMGSSRVAVSSDASGSDVTLTSSGRLNTSVKRLEIQATAAGGAGVAMIAYAKNGSNAPQFRTWDGSAWSSEAAATSAGSRPQWVVLRGSPVTSDFALATLDNDVDVEVQLYSGSTWGTLYQACGDAGDKTTRLFDLAYEQLSGHLLLVYRKSGSSNVCFRTHDGTSWSGESSYALSIGTIKWLTLTPRPGTDEMMLIAQGDAGSNHCRAAYWTGSAFSNPSVLASGASPGNNNHAHAAFEATSGDALVTYSSGAATPGYRTLVAGAWSGSLSAPTVGATPAWTRVAASPTGNSVVFASHDSENDINANVWNGTSWGSNQQLETSIGTYVSRSVDVAWQAGGDAALLVYGESGNTLKYRTWNGSAWSAEGSGPNGGNSPIWTVQAVTGASDGQVIVLHGMDNAQIRASVWTGTSFTGQTAIGTSGTNKEYESFMAAVSGQSGGGSTVISSWIELPRY